MFVVNLKPLVKVALTLYLPTPPDLRKVMTNLVPRDKNRVNAPHSVRHFGHFLTYCVTSWSCIELPPGLKKLISHLNTF